MNGLELDDMYERDTEAEGSERIAKFESDDDGPAFGTNLFYSLAHLQGVKYAGDDR